MVDDEVHHDLHSTLVRRLRQVVEVGQAAEERVDILVVADVVAVVVLGRAVDRAEPEYIDTETGQVVELRDDALNVADAVAIGVREATWVDLVDDSTLPPRAIAN